MGTMNDLPPDGQTVPSVEVPSVEGGDRAGIEVTGIEVVGPTRSVVFPPLCVRCGAPASATLRIIKLFRRSYLDEPRPYGIFWVDAPVCAACKALHRSQEQPPDPAVRRERLRRWYGEALLPYTLPLAALGVITYLLGPSLVPLIAQKVGMPAALVWGGIAAFFVLLALVFFAAFVARGMWRLIAVPSGAKSSWYARLERGPFGARLFLPIQPTAVIAALDFSDNIGDILAGQRHRYRFKNGEVGARFAEANAGRVWNPQSPRARISLAVWCVLFAGLILLILLAEFGDLAGIRLPFLRHK
jgi:hypothetical protein